MMPRKWATLSEKGGNARFRDEMHILEGRNARFNAAYCGLYSLKMVINDEMALAENAK
jgi:hypothetical protein